MQENQKPVSVIFDTDMGPDYDDAGALALLHALADKNEAKILAALASNRYKYTIPCIEIINTYFGRPDIPLGETKTGLNVTDNVNARWTDSLALKYPYRMKGNDVPDATSVYRRILATEKDKSVTIVAVGYLTNLAALLESKPDHNSKLSGRELVSKKVKCLVAMAGMFPQGKEYNMASDSVSSIVVSTDWPSPIIFCGFEVGNEILTGARLIKSGVVDNPVKDAYTIRMRNGDTAGRQSWDQLTILAAVRGTEPYFDVKKGFIKVAGDGSNTWTDDDNGTHYYLQRKMPVTELTNIIEELMMYLPKNQK